MKFVVKGYGSNRPSKVVVFMPDNQIVVYPNPGSGWLWNGTDVTLRDDGLGLHRWVIHP